MEPLQSINHLNGASVVPRADNAWGPFGTLGVSNLRVDGPDVHFDLLVPTSPHDIWDYIWSSERERGTTDKIQLFQSGLAVQGSRITAIARQGMDERWDETGPEQYRLTFVLPFASLHPGEPLEVRFFRSGNLMSTALGMG